MTKVSKNEILAKLFAGERVRATSWSEESFIIFKDGMVVTNDGEAFDITASTEKEWSVWVEPVKKSKAVITKDEAIQALFSGERVRSVGWIASYVELVNGQPTDEKGQLYDMMSADIDKWEIWTDEVSNNDSNQLAEVKAMLTELLSKKEVKADNTDGRSVGGQINTSELLLAVYGVNTPADIEEQFKEAFEGANSSRDVQQIVCDFIPYCWIGGRALNTTKQYYTKMRKIIKDSNSKYKDEALAIFLPPAKLYDSLQKHTDTIKKEKMADSAESFNVENMKQIIAGLKELIDGGEDAIVSTKSRQQTIERATAYVYATYLAFVTGRRQSEILKTLKIVNRKGTWYYDGILKNGEEGKSIEAYALDDDFKFLQTLVTYVQNHLGTDKMSIVEVNRKFNNPFNSALKRLTGGNYTFKYVREVYSELMWLEHGNNGSWKDREAYKAKILGHEYDEALSTTEHYMGLKGV